MQKKVNLEGKLAKSVHEDDHDAHGDDVDDDGDDDDEDDGDIGDDDDIGDGDDTHQHGTAAEQRPQQRHGPVC